MESVQSSIEIEIDRVLRQSWAISFQDTCINYFTYPDYRRFHLIG